MARSLIGLGLLLVVLGLWLQFGQKLGMSWLGKLPGDLHFQGDLWSVHVPFMTCLLLSVGISAVIWLIRRFFGGS